MVVLAAMVGTACREVSPPDVQLLGASAVRDDAGRVFLFDGVAQPRLSVGGSGEVSVRVSDLEITPVGRRRVAGRVLLTLPRPEGMGPRLLEVRRAGGVWRQRIVLRPDPFSAPAVRVVALAADQDSRSAKARLSGLEDDLWPWGCVEWARRVPAEGRANADLECADGAGE